MSKNPLLFENVVERYVKFVLPHRVKDLERQAKLLDYWKDTFRGREIGSLKVSEVSAARDALLLKTQEAITTRGGYGTGIVAVNRSLARLKNLFNVCRDEWEYGVGVSVKNVKLYKESKGRIRFLTTAEVVNLLKECMKSKNNELYLAVLMILVSGARKTEILNMKFEHLDYTEMTGYLPTQKNSEEGKLYFTEDVMRLLKEKRRKTGNIFEITHIDIGFKLAAKRAGLENLHVHDLRHTFASQMASNGASALELAEALRLKTLTLVRRYAHLMPSQVSVTIRNVSKHWRVPVEDRGWDFSEGKTMAAKYPGTLL